MIIISYPDFRKLSNENNKRIYYFQMDNVLELAFITEGIFVKSFVNLETIENKEEFFSQQMFINATKLLFRISNPNESNIGLVRTEPGLIAQIQTIEAKEQEKDLQKDGVEQAIPGV